MRSSVPFVAMVGLAVTLSGCDKIAGLTKSAPDAAPTSDAAPSAPPVVVDAAVPDASPATTAVVKPVFVAHKDAGAVDASADASAAFVQPRQTRGAFVCDSPGCQCEAGASCDITCPPKGACNVLVREIATATIHGGATPLTLQCNKGATCHVQGGPAVSQIRCTGAKCDVECRTGPCNLTCESGGRCTIAKKGVGAVKCDGC